MLRGGDGDDTLNGDAGNDRFIADKGADNYDGGEGRDGYFGLTATHAVAVNLARGTASGADTGNDKLASIMLKHMADASAVTIEDFRLF